MRRQARLARTAPTRNEPAAVRGRERDNAAGSLEASLRRAVAWLSHCPRYDGEKREYADEDHDDRDRVDRRMRRAMARPGDRGELAVTQIGNHPAKMPNRDD